MRLSRRRSGTTGRGGEERVSSAPRVEGERAGEKERW